jgi:hypothetical protein
VFSRPLALELAVFDPELRPKGERREMMNHLSDSLRGGIRQNVPSAVGGECLSALCSGSFKLNGKSVIVKYDEDLLRERDSNLTRFPLSGNLIKKL